MTTSGRCACGKRRRIPPEPTLLFGVTGVPGRSERESGRSERALRKGKWKRAREREKQQLRPRLREGSTNFSPRPRLVGFRSEEFDYFSQPSTISVHYHDAQSGEANATRSPWTRSRFSFWWIATGNQDQGRQRRARARAAPCWTSDQEVYMRRVTVMSLETLLSDEELVHFDCQGQE